ncbi:hypothetical protein N7532_006147 [Penicillium argentinense]|uniref:Methyltransferase domain-containing protein n=1 Tax=Penicillium argentinense TaxID=1131581 RepID=A0A9W9FFG1_9EURO|nr:uncharacterized protein N7532_006147 [Penicillium argentinense]KAJ5099146.1 hypothetical protein N7532_006147 [Penicillium argentinense]
MCYRRSRGYPLQYILGDQPFGNLEILCRPGVLIPRFDRSATPLCRVADLAHRSDTEAYAYQAAKLVVDQVAIPQEAQEGQQGEERPDSLHGSKPLQILDLCTGTGCIALLVHTLLAPRFERMRIIGIDISPKALSLARQNLDYNLHRGLLGQRASTEIQFHRADVLGPGDDLTPNVEKIASEYLDPAEESDGAPPRPRCDLLISNPPYISTSDFRNGTTSRSVRLFEPKLALVPPTNNCPSGDEHSRPEDVFYTRILALSLKMQTKITVLECGDIKQAERVVAIHTSMTTENPDVFETEIWPSTEQDMSSHGFHPHQGSRCVIIQRRQN